MPAASSDGEDFFIQIISVSCSYQIFQKTPRAPYFERGAWFPRFGGSSGLVGACFWAPGAARFGAPPPQQGKSPAKATHPKADQPPGGVVAAACCRPIVFFLSPSLFYFGWAAAPPPPKKIAHLAFSFRLGGPLFRLSVPFSYLGGLLFYFGDRKERLWKHQLYLCASRNYCAFFLIFICFCTGALAPPLCELFLRRLGARFGWARPSIFTIPNSRLITPKSFFIIMPHTVLKTNWHQH